jgi:hypothetical protein
MQTRREQENEGGIECERKTKLASNKYLELYPRFSQPHYKRATLVFVSPTSHNNLKLDIDNLPR